MSDGSASVRDRISRGLVSVTARAVIVRFIGLLGTLVLARLLSPSDFGVIALGFGLMTFGKFLADGGMVPGLIRRPEAPQRPELAALYGLQLSVFAVVAGVTAIVASSHGDAGLTLTLMAASLLIDAARVPTNVMLERDLDYRLMVRVEVLDSLVFNAAGVALVALGAPVWGVGVAALGKSVVGTTLLVRGGPVGLPRPSLAFGRLRGVLRFGVYFQGAWLAMLLRDQGLNVLLASISGTAALGAWALAQRALSVLTTLFEAAWRVALPGMARLLEAGEVARSLLERALGLAATASGFPIVLLVGTAPALVPTVFGGGWERTIDVLPWIGAGAMLVIPLGTVLTSLLWAQDEAAKVAKMIVPSLVVTLALGAALMPGLDVQAAGIASFAGALIYLVGCVHYSRDQFGWIAVVRLIVPTGAAAAATALAWIVASELDPRGLAMVLSGIVGEATYLAVLLLLGREPLLRMVRMATRMRSPVTAT